MTDRVERFLAASNTQRAGIWSTMTPEERHKVRDLSDLTPQLVGWEGWRAEVDDEGRPGHKRRFIVGRSRGWRPCHLELYNRRSHGGGPAAKSYTGLRFVEKVR